MHTIARTTGLFYLGMAVTGIGFYLVLLPQLFAAGDPAATLANLAAHDTLARGIVAVELLMVVAQALTAVWFYRLFSTADPFAAGCIAAFGLVGAVAGLVSAALLGTAVQVAADPFGDAAATVQILFLTSDNAWGVGALFFGLWLVPMGWCVLRSGWMPRTLGWLLVAGGAGYVLNAFVRYLAPGAPAFAEALTIPASIGELWMVGYLLLRGVRRQAPAAAPPAVPTPAPAAG